MRERKGGLAKAVMTLIVTLFLGMAVIACTGPAGAPGTPGTPGTAGTPGTPGTPQPIQPTQPVVPVPAGSIADMSLQVGWSDTVDVAGNFDELQEQPLTYSAKTDKASIATAMTDGSSKIMVTAVAVGMAKVTVTATDTEGGTADQTFTVTVTEKMPPMAVDSLDELMLYVGDTTTVDVKGNFTGGVPLGLTYSAVSDDERIAKATVADGSSEVMVTAVADGRIFITVTATDYGGDSAPQNLRVNVSPADEKPVPDPDPIVPDPDPIVPDTDPIVPATEYSDCAMLAPGAECTVTVDEGQRLDPDDMALVEVSRDSGNDNAWTVTAQEAKGETHVAIVNADRSEADRFSVEVINVAPERKVATEDPKTVHRLAPGSSPNEMFKMIMETKLDAYFKDANNDSLTYRGMASTPHVIVRNETTADTIYLDVLQNVGPFTLSIYAVDEKGKGLKSDLPVILSVDSTDADNNLRSYDVEQFSNGGFEDPLEVGYRIGPTYTLDFLPIITGMTQTTGLKFVKNWNDAHNDAEDPFMVSNIDSTTHPMEATLDQMNNDHDDVLSGSVGDGHIVVLVDRAITLSNFMAGSSADNDNPKLEFMVSGAGSAKITLEYYVFYDPNDGGENQWNFADSKMLALTIRRDVGPGTDYGLR